MAETDQRTPDAGQLAGYTRGEKIAGIVGAVLFLALAAIALDMATGGRLFGGAKMPCGCEDETGNVSGD